MQVWAGLPAFARPCEGDQRSTSLMSSSLLLQQCPSLWLYRGILTMSHIVSQARPRQWNMQLPSSLELHVWPGWRSIYYKAMRNRDQPNYCIAGWLADWVLWHINLWRLFNAKSIFMKIVLFQTIHFSITTQSKCEKRFYFKLFFLVKQF